MMQTAPVKELLTLQDALQMDRRTNVELNRLHLNPRLTQLLTLIGADNPVTRASGSHFWDADGRRFLDFLTGFAAASLGHNHPALIGAMTMMDTAPTLIEGLNHLAAALAHNLALLAPGNLQRVYFANSGTEAVDAAIKAARAATRRTRMLGCEGSFHGRSMASLSLMDRKDYRCAFEPMVPAITHIPFGDLKALERELRSGDVAGFVFEPIQGEAGMVLPPAGYLQGARDLCSRFGTLMIADEIQTGLGRTGTLFAVDHDGVAPDILLLGKALGGGIAAISAALTTEAIYLKAGGATPRSPFHNPTFGGNARSCAAGLATLNVIVSEGLDRRARDLGGYLMEQLRALQTRQPLIAEVRGRGLMIGVEFAPATSGLASLVTAGVLNRLSNSFLSGIVVMRLRRQHGIMTAFSLNNPNVLRLQPPLNIEKCHLDECVAALDETLSGIRSFPRAALSTWRELRRAGGPETE